MQGMSKETRALPNGDTLHIEADGFRWIEKAPEPARKSELCNVCHDYHLETPEETA